MKLSTMSYLVFACILTSLIGCASTSNSSNPNAMTEVKIDRIDWSDRNWKNYDMKRPWPFLMLHVANYDDWASFEEFTKTADKAFYLEKDGKVIAELWGGAGGYSSGPADKRDCWAGLSISEPTWEFLQEGHAVTLRARNEVDGHQWNLISNIVPRR